MFGSALSLPFEISKAEMTSTPITPSPKKSQYNQKLSFGSVGDSVFEVQSYLKAFDYYRGVHDGVYGLLTKQAVTSFQKNHKLTIDGISGPQTLGHLIHSSDVSVNVNNTMLMSSIQIQENNPEEVLIAKEDTSVLKGESIQLYKIGDQGSQIKKFQEVLEDHGYYDGVDGIFGSKTMSAVKEFQRVHNLAVDGIIGPETKKMFENTEEIIDYSPPTPEITASATVDIQKTDETQAAEVAIAETTEQQQEPVEKSVSTHSSNLITTASSLKGTPYVWGGTTPAGFDCSGFIQYVFNQHGKKLPRTTKELFNQGQPVSTLQAGDIVFFTTYRSGPSHAGIYIGDRQFIHSGSSNGVTHASLDSSYWSKRYLGAKRF
nr:peptidoglycan-binding protein [Bacillus suaedae]